LDIAVLFIFWWILLNEGANVAALAQERSVPVEE